ERQLLRRLLEQYSVKVATAGLPNDGMKLMTDGGFDVVISDIGMPGEDGYSFIARLRQFERDKSRPRTPAVALTAYARPDDRRRIMLSGYQVHAAKPIESDELLAIVANLAGRT